MTLPRKPKIEDYLDDLAHCIIDIIFQFNLQPQAPTTQVNQSIQFLMTEIKVKIRHDQVEHFSVAEYIIAQKYPHTKPNIAFIKYLKTIVFRRNNLKI